MDDKENFSPIEVMRRLFEKDYENKVCVECKCPMPSFVSINNAILLCDRCAKRHMNLGYNVSYIRNLASNWDAYLYSYMDRGGNSRYIRLSKKYELDSMPIEQKFNTRILEYYRLLIKSEVLADAPPFEIPYEVAKEPINNQIIYFPEFENYQIYEGKVKIEKKNHFGYIDAFRFVGNGLGSLATYLGEKYQEYDMNNKIIKGGAATLKGLAAAGKFIYKLSKPIVKYASIRTVQGIGYLAQQAEYQLSDDDGEEEEDEDKNTNKGNNKDKKKKKKKKKKDEDLTVSKNSENGNQNSFCLQEGDYIFQPCIEYPTFESINKVSDTNHNNNNIINDNININNYINNNAQNEINENYKINNKIITPDYVIPPGLESSSHESSIIGEK